MRKEERGDLFQLLLCLAILTAGCGRIDTGQPRSRASSPIAPDAEVALEGVHTDLPFTPDANPPENAIGAPEATTPAASSPFAKHLDRLRRGDEKTRIESLEALVHRDDGGSSPEEEEIANGIRLALTDSSVQVRALAALAAGEHPELADELAPALIAALRDPRTRDPAIRSLGELGVPDEAVGHVAAILRDPKQRTLTRRLAAEALAHADPAREDAVRALEGASKDADRQVGHAARKALALLEKESRGEPSREVTQNQEGSQRGRRNAP